MSYRVNKEKCIGCGYCTSVCPDVFELGEDGKSKVKENADFEKNEDCLKEAKEGCPVGAIEMSD
jgi:ferredoxin